MTDAVVVGVGNPTMRDDGIGHRIVDELETHPETPTDVGLYRTATSSFLALEALDGAAHAVVVDALDAHDAPPGTIHRYRFQDDAFEGEAPQVLMHDLSFSDALTVGGDAYDIPDEVLLVGVQPASLDVGLELSDPIEAAVPSVVEAVLDALDVDAPDPPANTHATRTDEPPSTTSHTNS